MTPCFAEPLSDWIGPQLRDFASRAANRWTPTIDSTDAEIEAQAGRLARELCPTRPVPPKYIDNPRAFKRDLRERSASVPGAFTMEPLPGIQLHLEVTSPALCAYAATTGARILPGTLYPSGKPEWATTEHRYPLGTIEGRGDGSGDLVFTIAWPFEAATLDRLALAVAKSVQNIERELALSWHPFAEIKREFEERRAVLRQMRSAGDKMDRELAKLEGVTILTDEPAVEVPAADEVLSFVG